MEKAVYAIRGLDCADEVGLLRRALAGRRGVAELEFDILNARMAVTFDPAATSPAEIVAAVASTGMKAAPWGPTGGAAHERLAGRLAVAGESFWERRGRLVAAGLSLMLLVAGFVAHCLAHGSLIHAILPAAAGHAYPVSSMLLFAASALAGAWFVLPRAARAARHLRPDMNLLMTIAIVGAAGLGDWFESATVALLFAVALWLEQWSVGRARRAIAALMDLSPPTARVVCPSDGDLTDTPVAEVAVGATVLVRPGERVPLDGRITKGAGTVNQAPITGESMPVPKAAGDEVFAGTINEEAVLELTVTRPANDTTLARIIHLVQEAQGRKAPSQQWVDRFAHYYTPLMMALAVAVVLGPPLFFSAPWAGWIYRGLLVLVIACPCALVISTPVSVVSGLASAARNGVLIKGGVHLESAGRLRAVALDKTGTLTHGRPEVQRIVPLNGHSAAELLERAAAMESHSDHPLARAILRRAEEDGVRVAPAEGFRIIKGKGAEAMLDGRRFWIGSHRFMHEVSEETPEIHREMEALEDAGHSVLAVGNDQHVCGLISMADGVREAAAGVVAALKRLGVSPVVMLTGDNGRTAAAVAKAVGVDEHYAELLPEDKLRLVGELVGRRGQVAMVGDGVNDAPAMAASTLGVAMGAMGSDAAIETADVALMSDDLTKLPWLIAHSRRTVRTIQQNIAFALGVKVVFLGLALAGLATLWMAIAADMGASLLVIFNGLRLLGGGAGFRR